METYKILLFFLFMPGWLTKGFKLFFIKIIDITELQQSREKIFCMSVDGSEEGAGYPSLQENLLLRLLQRSYGAAVPATAAALHEQNRIDALWQAAEAAETDGSGGGTGTSQTGAGEPRRGKQSPDLGQVSAGSSLSSFRSSSAASGAPRPLKKAVHQRPPAPCPHHSVHCPEYRKVRSLSVNLDTVCSGSWGILHLKIV